MVGARWGGNNMRANAGKRAPNDSHNKHSTHPNKKHDKQAKQSPAPLKPETWRGKNLRSAMPMQAKRFVSKYSLSLDTWP